MLFRSEALDSVIGPFILKKDAAGAEAALAQFIKEKGIVGEAATRMSFNARMGIIMETKRGDHDAVIKLIDATLATDAKSDFAEELKGLRARVVQVRGDGEHVLGTHLHAPQALLAVTEGLVDELDLSHGSPLLAARGSTRA